ncbi:hypothetical protein ACHAWF_010181 [Thalassiosira exigua]
MEPPRWNMILFGDSDISRWPPSAYPSSPSLHPNIINRGKGGAELVDLLRQIDRWKDDAKDEKDADVQGAASNNLYLCCSGENDVGSGRSLDGILDAFRSVLDALFPAEDGEPDRGTPPRSGGESRLIFLGPKFEPWLANEHASRKTYAKLNNGFQRSMRKHRARDSICYIDCLTKFCTHETASAPGAVYGGRAMPDGRYFDADGLHLNETGYGVWKGLVEAKMVEMIGS